ncbi:hypothetical protein [Phenylobacterium sp.]|uniref:hypothetical protein n=1 Tax=Phenylobacterium sp. TaxID=1871053 RepID=UPI0035B4EBE8
MTWFERLTGFAESSYEATRQKLAVEGDRLRSQVNGAAYHIGSLELASLGELRERALRLSRASGQLAVRNVSGDVRKMHQAKEHAGALFQVASQFNLLEMVGPDVSPEDGVTRYAYDATQGPACAIAAGAATIYRNYFAPVGGELGQTARRQLDGLASMGAALSHALDRPRDELWTMQNGYALCTRSGLGAISEHLAALDETNLDRLRSRLQIGLHWDVQATEHPGPEVQLVSQAFCSALPVAYGVRPAELWGPFAKLVLEAAYEATLWAALLNAKRGASKTVLLTRLGGGAFGNRDAWIDEAMYRALDLFRGQNLEVRLVSYGAPPSSSLELEARFQR